MPSRTVVIRMAGGAHARPVAELVRLAASHPRPVTLTTQDGRTVDLTSVLAVMELGLVAGDEVVLRTDGADATVLDAMHGVLSGE